MGGVHQLLLKKLHPILFFLFSKYRNPVRFTYSEATKHKPLNPTSRDM